MAFSRKAVVLASIGAATLSGCIPAGRSPEARASRDDSVRIATPPSPPRRSTAANRPAAPRSTPVRSAGATVPAAPDWREGERCISNLSAVGARFTPLADRDMGENCSARSSVRLSDVGVAQTNLGPMTCSLAGAYTGWIRNAVQPAARQVYGKEVVRVETFGTLACRNIYNLQAGPRSEHAYANAVDVAAFVLEDGTKVSVLGGWRGDERDQRFLRLLHTSACRRFGTVLGPEYNAAHANHFHFDMAARRFCR